MPSISAVLTGGATLPLELVAGAASKAAKASGPGSATPTAKTTAKPAAKTTAAAKKATSTKKATTTKTPTAKATGYATRLPADYAFLRDPRLSIEEKLSRFIGLAMTKSEQDLLAQMEKMAPGSTAAGAGATTSSAAKPAARKVSIWSLAKTILPPLGMASQLVGDATLKKIVQQVSGPVLAAAATAVGGPALGALASQLGPTIGGLITRDVQVDLSGLASMVGLGGGTSASTSAGSGTAGSSGTAGAASAGGTSEKAQLMELQRLQDRDKELFSLFSNMLKAMHDSRMTCIQNLR